MCDCTIAVRTIAIGQNLEFFMSAFYPCELIATDSLVKPPKLSWEERLPLSRDNTRHQNIRVGVGGWNTILGTAQTGRGEAAS